MMNCVNGLVSLSPPADVSPHGEPIFILTSGQLQCLIETAIKPLRDEVESLRSTEERDISRLALDIAYDRQRISRLERVEPQPLQRDRADILRALLAANGGKMLAKDARKLMHLSKSRFSELLSKTADDIEKRPYHLDHTQNIIILR
jgi:hypothetical protein